MKCYILGALIALMSVGVAAAGPPANTSVDPELKRWFESLRQPGTQRPCCSISDCRFVAFAVRDGHYEIEIDGFVYVIPEKAIIAEIPNPTAKAVACYSYLEFKPPPAPGTVSTGPQDIAEILCFVLPQSISHSVPLALPAGDPS